MTREKQSALSKSGVREVVVGPREGREKNIYTYMM